MLHLLVDNTWKVLIAHDISFLAQFSDVNLATKVSISHNISDSEFGHLYFGGQQLLNILDGQLGSFFGISLRLRPNNDHPTWFKDEDGAFRFSFSEDDSRKSLFIVATASNFLCNELQIQVILAQLGKRHHILNQGKVLLIVGVLHVPKQNINFYTFSGLINSWTF